ncbi:MAG: hypothetical protein ACTHMZ_08260, partial [Actinomycetes bacterium]
MTSTVMLQLWQVRSRDVPGAVVAGGLSARRLRRQREVSFAKFLGTSSDAFVPSAATPRRWATLICRRGSGQLRQPWWEGHAVEHAALTLRPLSSHGSWDGHAPFDVPNTRQHWDGPVVVL